jgi:transglutaminase-like putative cysteine protease
MIALAPVLAALVAAASKPAPARALAAPWERPAFSAPAAEVAKAAAALPDPTGKKKPVVEVLLEEGTFTFDDAGRLTYAYRLVYRPLTRDAAESWAEVSRAWSPWHEERPTVRARVVHPDGTEHVLDPSTLSEGAADDSQDVMYFDRRLLRGPIPHVAERTVVEEESVVRETAPIFDRGTVHRWWVGRPTVTRKIRLVISAPEKLPLAWAVRGGLPGTPVERRESGRRTVVFTWTDVPARKALEPSLPPEQATSPHVAFGTGASWQQIAGAYADTVDRQLAGADLAARAREIVGASTDRREVAQKLLDWISGKVRYTGLELGQSAIVPVPPAESLKRGYGDCKDLSLLLTGLLRALGHPAELALVRTEPDDVAEIPGLGEFDHAIVHVPGTPELWIDPTDPDTAAGELPRGDQGRLALLANRGTRKLVRTPDMAAEANRVELDREIVMSESGRARASETRLLRGSRAAEERRAHRRTPAADLAKEDEATAKELFAEAKLVGARRDGLDGAGAVTVRLEADQSRWGVTADSDAEVVVGGSQVFARLPLSLRPKPAAEAGAEHGAPAEATPDDDADDDDGDRDASVDAAADRDGDDGDAEDAAATAKPRTADILAPEAHETVVRYRVVPPPGFTAAPLPEPVRIAVGPASYERSFTLEKDGVVTGVHRFTLSRRRVSAKDAEALEAALAPLGEDGPRVKFERVSEKLLAEGKGRQALDEIRRLVALHPTEARHHAHLAYALLRLGMGEAARKEARRAVELEPSNGWAHRVLANTLEHDLIGRYLQPGCELEGAAAAQRRAVELEKDQPAARAHLAFILEHGNRCQQWAKGAKLDEAAKVLRAIRKELKNREHDGELLEVYLRAERFTDARALAKEMKDSPDRRAALLAATAALDGVPAAVAEAAKLATADRSTALAAAGLPLLRARRYPEAAAILEAAGQGSSSSADLRARAALIARIRRAEAIPYDKADPATLFPRLVRDVLAGAEAGKLSDYVTGGEKSARDTLDGFRNGFEEATRSDKAAGLSAETIADIALSLLEWSKDGDGEAGYRIRYTFTFSPTPLTVYAVPTERGWRVVGETPDFPTLAAFAWKRAESGKLAAARRLLRFAKEDAPRGTDASPAAILAALWTHGDAAGADELRVAAAALAAVRNDADATRAVEQARAKETDPARRRALGWALAASHVEGGRWAAALALAPELSGGEGAAQVFDLQATALVRLGRRAELATLAAARRKAAADDVQPIRWLRRDAAAAGDVDEALRVGAELLATGRADANDWNETAWAALFKDPLAPGALEQARKAVLLTQEKSAGVLHTLAMVHAERGDGAEALQVLAKSIAARSGAEPTSADWLVVARVAESYGLVDEAVAAYGRVKPQKDEILGSHLLAARRLEKLGKKGTVATAKP